ncbi:MAG: MarR family transcriptional regulator [Planctomycetota bacterium]|nr:MAG: MarR family transcriptional regulator [Planctomycetota bacterium]
MSPLQQAKTLLVQRWGEMGGYWGINRSMAEIHALLFVTREPLCTDEIMDQLKISRGNASMNLRALVDWGLVRRVHKLGQRREFFQADTDIWSMFETIMRERRRREVEPIIATIERCREMVSQSDAGADDPQDVREFQRRTAELAAFLSAMGQLFEVVLATGGGGVNDLAAMLEHAAAPAERNSRKQRAATKR